MKEEPSDARISNSNLTYA